MNRLETSPVSVMGTSPFRAIDAGGGWQLT